MYCITFRLTLPNTFTVGISLFGIRIACRRFFFGLALRNIKPHPSTVDYFTLMTLAGSKAGALCGIFVFGERVAAGCGDLGGGDENLLGGEVFFLGAMSVLESLTTSLAEKESVLSMCRR